MDKRYRDALLSEIDLITYSTIIQGTDDAHQQSNNNRIPLRSIYFGGGTPSLAPADTIQAILDRILTHKNGPFIVPNNNNPNSRRGIQDELEITMEMDPGTFDKPKLIKLKNAGINRISLGVQSTHNDLLENLGRTHRFQDVLKSIEMIHEVYKENINYSIDLISGIPGLSMAKWIETLHIVTTQLNPPPDHISLYDLQVEKGTVFGQWYEDSILNVDDDNDLDDIGNRNVGGKHDKYTNGKKQSHITTFNQNESIINRSRLQLPSPEECAFMYRYASGYLKAKGYEHYEVSSYARIMDSPPSSSERSTSSSSSAPKKTRNGKGRRSRHNQIYWEICSSWYAIGLGATSSIRGKQYARPREMHDYIQWVNRTLTTYTENTTQYISKESDMSSPSTLQNEVWLPPWLPEENDKSDPWLESNIFKYKSETDESDDYLLDVIMTRLRTKEGLDLDRIVNVWSNGHEKVKNILRGAQLGLDLGLLELLRETELGSSNGRYGESNDEIVVDSTIELSSLPSSYGILCPVDPDGFLFSNSIISAIFSEL
eukprot:CAMPEP_0184861674 /NCGR_PEP_ID=MMETSP0580-20130426/6297_1 /TAXON_ID=1118495 /ORGANISM="Dactyliosolen fragilissimus" /LENGTH=542 /DNA_ID=CAMNT_0027359247 /DNA_START=616 /DNA_END=2244 /DNA_ORIENTATION=+